MTFYLLLSNMDTFLRQFLENNPGQSLDMEALFKKFANYHVNIRFNFFKDLIMWLDSHTHENDVLKDLPINLVIQ